MPLPTSTIDRLLQFPEIADVIWTDGKIKSVDKSKILTWHFGIVPGVIAEEIARILSQFSYRDSAFETIYESPLKPWDDIYIEWGDGVFHLKRNNWNNILTLSNVAAPNHPEFKWANHSVFQKDLELDDHLLQSGAFRLASDANPIGMDWSFSGYWTPLSHEFSANWMLPFSFMKEAANQIIALSFSQEKNPKWVKNWSTILLKSSEVWKDKSKWEIDMEMRLWDTLVIVGSWEFGKWNKWRDTWARYSAYNANDLKSPLFHWKITWTQVQSRILSR
jgi:hypothetical protein